jgi:hypothetical protein
VQYSYPLCEAFIQMVNWTDMWNPKNADVFSLWMHSKDFKYTCNMEFALDDPLRYKPFECDLPAGSDL